MNDPDDPKPAPFETPFSRQVDRQSARRLRAKRFPGRSVWFGLGMTGLIGWSVAIPTLLGAALGVWVDKHYRSPYSWTLMLLMIGLIAGCLNAWRWVDQEYRAIREENDG